MAEERFDELVGFIQGAFGGNEWLSASAMTQEAQRRYGCDSRDVIRALRVAGAELRDVPTIRIEFRLR
jgi:hypothetical protein